jgi:peroxiredoxin
MGEKNQGDCMIKPFITSALTAALLLSAPLAAEEKAPAQAPKEQAFQGRTFHFTDTNGAKIDVAVTDKGISLPTLQGKNAVMIFYIYSGTPCRNELKLFTKLKPELKDLEFVTFELKGLSPEKLKAFEKELGLKGLHMIDSAQAVPFAQYMAQLLQWPGSVPLIIAVTKTGEVKHMQLGAMNEEQVRKLAEMLNK